MKIAKLSMRYTDIYKSELVQLIKILNTTNIIMAEIGSYAGESTELFLSTNKVKKYIVQTYGKILQKIMNV